MYKELIQETKAILESDPSIYDGGSGYIHGKPGVKNIVKPRAAVVFMTLLNGKRMIEESAYPDSLYNKKRVAELTIFCFGKPGKTEEEAEYDCLDLIEKVEELLDGEKILVRRSDGSLEYRFWEYIKTEDHEMKQTGYVKSLTYQMELFR